MPPKMPKSPQIPIIPPLTDAATQRHYEMFMEHKVRHRRAEAERQMAEYERIRNLREGRDDVQVELRPNGREGGMEIIVHLGNGMHVGHRVRPEEMHMLEDPEHGFIRHIVGYMARQLTEHLEDRIGPGILRALDNARRDFGDMRRGMWERARENIRHGMDLAAGAVTGPKAKPDHPEPIKACDGKPPLVEAGPFKARLLADTMALWAESENMRHCIYKSYTNRIQNGHYLAYHIDAPRPLNKSGYTLGFSRDERGWRQDQIKGKANSIPNDPALLAFCQYVLAVLNGHAPAKDAMVKEIQKAQLKAEIRAELTGVDWGSL